MTAQSTLARAPQQERSRRTMDRMLDAAEQILEGETFASMRVQEVARRAGVTTGALYARFADKGGLQRALEARLHEGFGSGLAQEIDPARWATEPLRPLLEALLRRMLKGYRARGGLVRALVLESRRDPELAERIDRFNRGSFIEPLEEALASRPELDGREGMKTIRFALFAMVNLMVTFAVLPETDPIGPELSDEEMVERLAFMTAELLLER